MRTSTKKLGLVALIPSLAALTMITPGCGDTAPPEPTRGGAPNGTGGGPGLLRDNSSPVFDQLNHVFCVSVRHRAPVYRDAAERSGRVVNLRLHQRIENLLGLRERDTTHRRNHPLRENLPVGRGAARAGAGRGGFGGVGVAGSAASETCSWC